MDLQWDDENVEHVARHGVAPEEVEEALQDTRRIGAPTYHAAGELRWALIGATEAGRVLFIVYTRRSGTVRVVTARDAVPREKRRYHRR
ncbi:MAG: BrnT family toxin [Chloroflexi bacterium]|nr:BrnT family toxin [Chloroflexota bacterium]